MGNGKWRVVREGAGACTRPSTVMPFLGPPGGWGRTPPCGPPQGGDEVSRPATAR